MRKTIFLIIAIIVVATMIDWSKSCSEVKTDKELFLEKLTYDDLYEYKDPDYDFAIRYPSFFNQQYDSLNEDTGCARFVYNDQWVTIVLEGYMMDRQGQDVKSAADSIAKTLHATDVKLGKDYFILSGPQYENGGRIDNYSHYSKFIGNGKFWFVYTMIYPDSYHDVLSRLFKEIDEWQIWERPRLELKQGESQTPRAVSE